MTHLSLDADIYRLVFTIWYARFIVIFNWCIICILYVILNRPYRLIISSTIIYVIMRRNDLKCVYTVDIHHVLELDLLHGCIQLFANLPIIQKWNHIFLGKSLPGYWSFKVAMIYHTDKSFVLYVLSNENADCNELLYVNLF